MKIPGRIQQLLTAASADGEWLTWWELQIAYLRQWGKIVSKRAIFDSLPRGAVSRRRSKGAAAGLLEYSSGAAEASEAKP